MTLILIMIVIIFRYKREEVKIQAWETSQQAKFEAEKRRIEVIKCSISYVKQFGIGRNTDFNEV